MNRLRATIICLLVLLCAVLALPAEGAAQSVAGQSRDWAEPLSAPQPQSAAPVENGPSAPVPGTEQAVPEPVPPEPVPPEPVPPEPVPSEPDPLEVAPPEPAVPEPALPEPAAPAPEAVSRTRTVQVVVQVQVGCRVHCRDTSQSQTAVQTVRTEQTAVAPDGVARNESVTEQYAWQFQLGCVAFCERTSQTQTVEQHATTAQTAIGVDTGNDSTIVQVSHQTQQRGGLRRFWRTIDAFLRELAQDPTATVQVIRQVQVAECLRQCSGQVQLQLAVQQAVVLQRAVTAAVVLTD